MKTGALRTVVAATLIAAFGITSVVAQSTGSIAGRVKDIRTGQYLENARVTVEDTNLRAQTDSFGQFRLSGVPTGTAEVTVFYTGFFPTTQTIEVSETITAQVEIDLRSQGAFDSDDEVYELDAFVVKSQYDAAAAAIHEQRFAQSNVSVIDSEALGNINEGNIGEFVKFLPGISINYVAADVRSIEVRGMGSNFTNVTIDGNNMASASSSSMNRSFELEQVSLNNVERLEVVKVPTSDMPASSLGGSVNLVSKSAFERDGREIRYNAYLSGNSETLSFAKTYGPGNKDTLKILPGFRLTYADVYNDGKLGIIANVLSSSQFNPQHRTQMRWQFDEYRGGFSDPQPILRAYHMQDGPKNSYRNSFNVKLDYKLSENTFLLTSLQWNDYLSQFRNTNLTWDTGVNTSAQNQSSEPGVVLSAKGKGRLDFGGAWRDKYGETTHGDVRIEHKMENLKLQAGAYWSKGTNKYRSDTKGFMNSATLNWINADGQLRLSDFGGNGDLDLTTTVEHIDGAGVNNPGLAASDLSVFQFNETALDNRADSEDKWIGLNFDATYQLTGNLSGYLKTGARFTSQERYADGSRTRYYHVGPDGVRNSGDEFVSGQFLNDKGAFQDPHYGIPSVIAWPDFAKVKDYYDANPNHFTLRVIDGSGINEIEEDILSGYAMGSIDLLNKRAAITAGVRWEKTTVKAKGNRDTRKLDSDYDGLYPSIALRWDITDRLVGRLAYAKTIGRQNFSQLLPNATISYSDDQQEGSVRVNNLGLKPLDAGSIDVTLEYYTDNGGVLSVGYFNKDLSDYIRTVGRLVTQQDIQDFQLPADTLGFNLTTQVNGGDATVNGLEFNITQRLDFLPKEIGEFSAFINGTFLDIEGTFGGTTKVTNLNGFVKDTYNVGLTYQKGPLLTSLKFTSKGKELLGPYTGRNASAIGDVEQFNDTFQTVDFDLEWAFSREYVVYFAARNIGNSSQDRVYESESANLRILSQSEEYGVQFSLGVKGRF